MEQTNHFPWNTSMMVFVIDKDGRILLKETNSRLNTYRFDTSGQVDIRKMVCDEMFLCDILTYPEYIKHEGIIENEGKTFFIYVVNIFETNSPVPSVNSSWYSKDNLPFSRLLDLEKHVLTMILDGEKIGF